MVFDFLTKVFGSKNERELKQLQPFVERINALEPEMQAMSDESSKPRRPFSDSVLIREKPLTASCRRHLPLFREASLRTLKMRHFDVQLIGGIVLASRQNCRNENR